MAHFHDADSVLVMCRPWCGLATQTRLTSSFGLDLNVIYKSNSPLEIVTENLIHRTYHRSYNEIPPRPGSDSLSSSRQHVLFLSSLV